METDWYFRLLVPYIGWFVCSWLLYAVALVKAKRMGGQGWSKPMQTAISASVVGGATLMWFIPYTIDAPFWIGLAVIVLGLMLFLPGYAAMREYPERKQAVVDWGIYGVSRHSHVLSGMICLLGTVIMGWNPESAMYLLLWVYFVLYVALSHLGVLSEEELNVRRFGQEYLDYMKRVPRYFFGRI